MLLTEEQKRQHRMFWNQRAGARERGIEFLLTFEEWFQIWNESGHLAERGPYSKQYCMARFGDKGPYAVGNVRICTTDENQAEKWARPGYKEQMLEALKTRVYTEEVRDQWRKPCKEETKEILRQKNLGKVTPEETKYKQSEGMLGKQNAKGFVHCEETRARMSKGQTERWARIRAEKALQPLLPP